MDEADQCAPRLAIDVVRLEIGGRLQEEVIQVAVDLMASCFKSLKTSQLVEQPVEVLQLLLQRDDLEVGSRFYAFKGLRPLGIFIPQIDHEDGVFDMLLELSESVSKPHMELLWRCCRFQRLSASRVLQIATISEIPKEALVWALASSRTMVKQPSVPDWAQCWAHGSGIRGREILFVIGNARDYANKRYTRSECHRLFDKPRGEGRHPGSSGFIMLLS